MTCFVSIHAKEHATWPLIDILAEAAASKFHNRVIENITKRKLESANIKRSIITSTVNSTVTNHHLPVPAPHLTRKPVAVRTIVVAPSDLPVAKRSKINEGETSLSNSVKPPTAAQLYDEIPQDKNKSYHAVPDFFYVLFVMIKNNWLSERAFQGATMALSLFSTSHPDYAALITNVPKLNGVDFFSLRLPRHDYVDQVQIEPRRVWLLAALAVHYNLNYGLCIRYLGGEYIAKWRDFESIIGAVKVTPFCNVFLCP